MKKDQSPHFTKRLMFSKKMKKDYTILSPMMCPIHFRLLRPVFQRVGYKVELMENEGPDVIQKGLKYVHNDICYPCSLITGQMLATMESGKYDPDKVAMIITQSGGGCRDSNYINLMRKAFQRAGYPNVPFISANTWNMEYAPGIFLSPLTLLSAAAALVYGDALNLVSNQVRPYEVNKGATDALLDEWIEKLAKDFSKAKGISVSAMKKTVSEICRTFSEIEIKKVPKVKVAIIGELYLKYSVPGNNHLEEFLTEQDCEYFIPTVLGFGAYKTNGALEDLRKYGGNPIKRLIMEIVMKYYFFIEDLLIGSIEKWPMFTAPERVNDLKKRADGIIDTVNSMGEGWYLAAEMLELAEHGYENIICVQPFGCLPCHVAVKGMLNKVRRINPKINSVDIEYDPGATKVNQENRIKLMLAVARENLESEVNDSTKK
ncbi:MAG: 2-hydroxyacyl-CoA dehydratase [Lachnospiraceae bacterium]|nr:2-hydroxyacyl-CoA dehydratase [Lachnospiraceae bacterium]